MFITSLKNQKEFELVNKLGKKLHEKYFILVLAKELPKIFLEARAKHNNQALNQSQNIVFLGIKVSKKLAKKAVIRNKIKRRIRHLARLTFTTSKLNILKLGVIIIPRKGFDKINFSILNYELNKIVLQNR